MPGREIDQSILRLIIGTAVIGYLGFRAMSGAITTHLATMLVLAITFEFYTLTNIVAVLRSPKPVALRHSISIPIDAAAISYSMYVLGDSGAVLIPVYLWIIFGNGFRWGNRYLVASAVACLIGFTVAAFFNQAHWSGASIVIGTILSFILLPTYASILIRQLRDAIADAKEANEAKSRFLANVSHELRTPLNGVLGMSDLLINTKMTAQQRDYATTIHQSVYSLLSIIKNVLDFSKIEAGKESFESADFDLHKVIHLTIRMLRPMANEKGLSISTHISPHAPYALIGDPHHFQEVLLNLIGNSIKFTDKGGIDLRVDCLNDDGESVNLRFTIVDTGIGMSPDILTTIFEPYQQADDSTTRRYGGTGLGTSISKQLIELMGGTINVASEEGKGSTFWFDLPFQTQKKSESYDMASSRAIILTGLQQDPTAITDYFRSWNLSYTLKSDVDDVLQDIQQSVRSGLSYHAVIIARSYLDIDTQSFVEAAHRCGLSPDVPIILIDHDSPAGIREQILRNGINFILPYPVNKLELYNAVRSGTVLDYDPATISNLGIVPGKSTGSNILVADDSSVNLKVMQEILGRAGHVVTTVTSGMEALQLLDNSKFDLVILDMQMPDLSGIETLSLYRASRPANKLSPVMFVSANATRSAMQQALDAGAACYLTKPVASQLLIETIASIVSQSAEATPVATPPATSDQIVDTVLLEEITSESNRHEFLSNLIDSFQSDCASLIKQINATNGQGDTKLLRDLLHAVKGNASIVGAVRLAATCAKLEETISAGAQFLSKEQLMDIEHDFSDASRWLRRYIETENPATVPPKNSTYNS